MLRIVLGLLILTSSAYTPVWSAEDLDDQINKWCQSALKNDFLPLLSSLNEEQRQAMQERWTLTQSTIHNDHAERCNALLSLFNNDKAADHLMKLVAPHIDRLDLKPSANRLRQISKIIQQQSLGKDIAEDQRHLLRSLSIICHDFGNWIELSELNDHQKLRENIEVICKAVQSLEFSDADSLSKLSLEKAFQQLNALSQCLKTVLTNYNFDSDALLASIKLQNEDIDSINRILHIQFKLFNKAHNIKLHLKLDNKKWSINRHIHSIPMLP